MATDPPHQKRFRKRGGAKKKKNKDKPSSNNHSSSHPSNAPTSNYIPGFQAETGVRIDHDLQAYLQKLESDLYSLDPTLQTAQSFNPTSTSHDDDDVPPVVLLCRNAIRDLMQRIHEISRDNSAARLLETLIRNCQHPQLIAEALLAVLSCGATPVAALVSHHCASHVFETLLRGACDAEPSLFMSALAQVVSNWSAEEIFDIFHSPSGSHVFRLIVATLAGLPEEEPREAKLHDSTPDKLLTYIDRYKSPVPDECSQAVAKLATTLLDSDLSLPDLPWSATPCAALQSLTSGVAVADRSLAKKLVERTMHENFDDLIMDACGSRLIERAILCVGAGFVKSHFKSRLVELGRHGKANFCVQRYLLSLRGRGAVMGAWDELEDEIAQFLGFGKAREGVVLSLLRLTEVEGDDNCRRRASRSVARACGATGSKAKMVAGMLAFGSEAVWKRWQTGVATAGFSKLGLTGCSGDVLRVPNSVPWPGLLGTLIARCIMRFQGGPGQGVRDSMAALTDEEIVALCGGPVGSRLVEQWIEDGSMQRGGKIARKVVKAMFKVGNNGFLGVVRNSYGGMVVVKCASLVDSKTRSQMMEALASDFEELRRHSSGQIVVRKCRVEHYMRKGDMWKREESAKETRVRLFAEILEDGEDGEDGEEDRKKKRKKSKM